MRVRFLRAANTQFADAAVVPMFVHPGSRMFVPPAIMQWPCTLPIIGRDAVADNNYHMSKMRDLRGCSASNVGAVYRPHVRAFGDIVNRGRSVDLPQTVQLMHLSTVLGPVRVEAALLGLVFEVEPVKFGPL